MAFFLRYQEWTHKGVIVSDLVESGLSTTTLGAESIIRLHTRGRWQRPTANPLPSLLEAQERKLDADDATIGTKRRVYLRSTLREHP